MAELLLELYSEEIPASMQLPAEQGLSQILKNLCQKYSITYQEFLTFSGPCRITIVGKGLLDNIPANQTKIKGPSVDSSVEIIAAFRRSHQITHEALFTEAIKGKEYYFYHKEVAAKSTKSLLQDIIPLAIKEYSWPKSMHWGNNEITWIRPLKNILCLLNGELLAFAYAHLVSNNLTYGHKFLCFAPIIINNFQDYQQKLRNHAVILSRQERKTIILEQLEQLQTQHQYLSAGIRLDNILEASSHLNKNNQDLLEEILGLSEYPRVLVGQIPAEFLTLPNEVLTTVMRKHQRYLSTQDLNGQLTPYFLFVANIKAIDEQLVIAGNQRVLIARLADAIYFYQRDLKTELPILLNNLQTIIFHQKLGSMHDKVERLINISQALFPENSALYQAAKFCKADLASAMVLELPELQGVMGKYYSLNAKIKPEIAEAIAQHYSLPKDTAISQLGMLLALIDRLDSMIGLFLAGEIATGSKDPYGLRRHAITIIDLLVAGNINLQLKPAIHTIAQLYIANCPDLRRNEQVIPEILKFIEERVRQALRKELNSDQWALIDVILNLDVESDLLIIFAKLQELKHFTTTEAGKTFLTSYSRVYNILLANKEQQIPTSINQVLFCSYETELYEALHKVIARYHEVNTQDYQAIYYSLTSLSDPINQLFDNILIKSDDQILMRNRLALLQYFVMQLQVFGDFIKLSG